MTQILNYGLPSAAILAEALQNHGRTGANTFPAGLSRSTVIRSLSVFVADLENVCNPGEACYDNCIQASKELSRILDRVLDSTAAPVATNHLPTPTSMGNTTQLATPCSPTQSEAFMPAMNAMDMTNVELFNSDGLDSLQLPDWIKHFDWSNVGCDYDAL